MDNLLIVPEFLTPANYKLLRGRYASLLATGFTPRGTTATDCLLSAVDATAAKTLTDEVAARLRGHFPTLPDLVPDYTSYHRMTVGGSHPLHADAVTLTGEPNHTPHRIASAMLYLSEWSTDFTGGLIHFPGLDQVIPPRAGMLVGFLTTLDYRHEVTPVISGIRDAVAFWFKGKETGVAASPPCGCGGPCC